MVVISTFNLKINMRDFYKLQIRNGTTKTNHVDEVLKDNRITSHIDYAGEEFEKLKKGDVLLIHKGSYPICLVEVLYKILNKTEINGTDFGINYKVKILSYFEDLEESFKKNNEKVGHNGTFFPLYNDTKTLRFVKKWFDYIQIKENMENIKALLEYKKQIILQGPPGTGKTRLAKEIAKSIIGGQKKISLLEYVTNYIKEFKPNEESQKINNQSEELLNEFQETFNLESIKKLSIEDYALGSGSQDSFCYWIERELAPICKFSTGGAGTTVYGISYIKEDGELRVDNNEDPQVFIDKVKNALIEIIETKSFIKARNLKFRYSYILKILHSYYPSEYFPVLSKEHLKIFAKIFDVESKGLNDVELNQAINSKFLDLKKQFNSEITSVLLMRHLYGKLDIKENGMPEMLILDNEISISGESKIIQFHPSYTYEDFVRGIVVETNTHNQPEYKVVNKTLAAFAKKALDNPTANYVLIIDEINRANLPSVLGELIYALEYRYNEKTKNDKEAAVESIYALKDNDEDEVSNKTLMLPTNLFIIGTMNTADRSVGHIDYAIKRRFAFVDVLPEIEPVHPLIKEEFIKISNLFIKNFNGSSIPQVIEKSDSLASDFRPEDIWIGHSYFICKKEKSDENVDNEKAKPILNMKLKYEIIPLLKEYIKDGILNETEQVKTLMNELISKDFTK